VIVFFGWAWYNAALIAGMWRGTCPIRWNEGGMAEIKDFHRLYDGQFMGVFAK
jgi:hypothetical protein